MNRRQLGSAGIAASIFGSRSAAAQPRERISIPILLFARKRETPAALSRIEWPPEDDALQGARLGIADNEATGRLIGQRWELTERVLEPDEPFGDAAREALDSRSFAAIVADLPAADLPRLADLAAERGLAVLNATAPDDRLRSADCRANLFHVHPSRAMLADALMQFASRRRWTRSFLLVGAEPQDRAWAEAMRRSVRKFGLRIVAEREFSTGGADLRRSAVDEMPALTQGAEYEVVLVADETKDFARSVAFNTWLPRPVAGSAGLEPVAWSPAAEQWGAGQLQSRFEKLSGRPMTGLDWGAWASIRALGQALQRAAATDPAKVRAELLAPDFAINGFKGRSMSFRRWDRQLRQPVQLAGQGVVVAVAPVEGFLHRVTELDTLGFDESEATCGR